MTTSPLANISATRELLDAFGLATKHRLGQNFLIDNHVIERICALAAVRPSESVVEVGPGVGTLTLALVQEAARVTSIEMDTTLEPVLAAHAVDHANFRYIMGDALKVPYERISEVAGVPPTVLVANLPYNVAATIILNVFERMPAIERAIVMVQKEVADRIAGEPGTKAYGAYTAKLALYGHVTGRFEVPPRCFYPAPHVDSAVVRIERWAPGEGPLAQAAGAGRCAPQIQQGDAGLADDGPAGGRASDAPAHHVCRVIDAAFAQRRKTIRNSMGASGFDKAALDEAFERVGIAPTARAEALAPADFVRLAAALAQGCEPGARVASAVFETADGAERPSVGDADECRAAHQGGTAEAGR